ncbi:unnamed protein product [Boreogadus saida]
MVASCGSVAVQQPWTLMWSFLLLVSPVWSFQGAERPPPPSQVHADPLRWSAPPHHSGLSYTVQRKGFEAERWSDFLPCVETQKTSCNVTVLDAEASCVRLRVLAHGHSLTSDPEEACSQQGSSCSPEVQLSAHPGSMTVLLRPDHPRVLEYGAAMKYLVHLGREGEPLEEYGQSPSSLVIKELEEGGRYCVSVVLVYFSLPIGPPSCVKCQDIPQSGERARQPAWLVTLVLGISVTAVLVVLSVFYFLLFQSRRIKEWMRPPYVEPNCIRELRPVDPALTYQPIEEQCDRISLIHPFA